MILQSRDLLGENPAAFVLVIGIGLIGLIIGFTVHEFSHALTAHGEGDATARRMGRLTLNPVKHIDWLGFALILVAGFGWAKPVQVDPFNLRHGRLGMAWVAVAGPLSNFILAIALSQVFRFGLLPVVLDPTKVRDPNDALGLAFFYIVFYNLILGIVNLIPIPPLDGSKVFGGLLPERLYHNFLGFERYGALLLLAIVVSNLVWTLFLGGINALGVALVWPALHIFKLATGLTWF